RPTPESIAKTIAKFKPTLYFAVPTLYVSQLQAMPTTPLDSSSIRYCVSAGEPLPGTILQQWQQHTGLDILDGIGCTETLHTFISNRAGDVRANSSGRLVTGYTAQILDEHDHPVIIGETGRLMIKGDSIAVSYWNNTEKTASTMLGEWLNTGDRYYQDEDAYFHYCGRDDDMIKVGGIWCSPIEIETKLMEHSAVLEAAVVGKADEAGLIKPEAHIVLQQASTQTIQLADELEQHCKSGLAPYKYPRWFKFVDALPKTATGKIQRYRLRSPDGG
ncbi:MAG: AMP-binding protein, partial [Gammaproteobacteria bacterium]|nr:AMP-binding protein [Gammaproteobacteria bacterium]